MNFLLKIRLGMLCLMVSAIGFSLQAAPITETDLQYEIDEGHTAIISVTFLDDTRSDNSGSEDPFPEKYPAESLKLKEIIFEAFSSAIQNTYRFTEVRESTDSVALMGKKSITDISITIQQVSIHPDMTEDRSVLEGRVELVSTGSDGSLSEPVEFGLAGIGASAMEAVEHSAALLSIYIESIIREIILPEPQVAGAEWESVYTVYNQHPQLVTEHESIEIGDEFFVISGTGAQYGLVEVSNLIELSLAGSPYRNAAELDIIYSDIPITAGTAVVRADMTSHQFDSTITITPWAFGMQLALSGTDSSGFSPVIGVEALYSIQNPYDPNSIFSMPDNSLITSMFAGFSYRMIPPSVRSTGKGGIWNRTRVYINGGLSAGYMLEIPDNSGFEGFFFSGNYEMGIDWFITPGVTVVTGCGYRLGYPFTQASNSLFSAPYGEIGVTLRAIR